MGRNEHSKQIFLACMGSACSVWTTLGLPQLTVVCPFWVYTAQTQGCSLGHCPKQALRFVYFPGLSHSGSGSRVHRKGTDSVGHKLCAFPRSEQLRWPAAWWVHYPRWTVCLNHLPGPSCLVSRVYQKNTVPGMLCVSSGELISGWDPPGRCQLSRIPGRGG